MFILTSNSHKLQEYKEFGIEARLGIDIREVLGTIDEVIIYKILECEPFVIVEDTVLKVEDKEIVDIKFKLKEIKQHSKASWITSLGYHDNVNLYVYRGVVEGRIVTPVIEHETSFEPCFVPSGADVTLYELKKEGRKNNFSARRIALEAYRNRKPVLCKKILDIPSWVGEYQNKYSSSSS